MFVSFRTRWGPTKLQTNWNICLEIQECSACQILFAFWFKTVCSNQNCGLSRTHTTFLVRHIFLWEWKKIRLRSSSPVSNCKQSQPLLKSVPSANENQVPKPIHYKKKDEQERFICVSRHNFDLPRERSPQITKMKYNLTRRNTYHF